MQMIDTVDVTPLARADQRTRNTESGRTTREQRSIWSRETGVERGGGEVEGGGVRSLVLV